MFIHHDFQNTFSEMITSLPLLQHCPSLVYLRLRLKSTYHRQMFQSTAKFARYFSSWYSIVQQINENVSQIERVRLQSAFSLTIIRSSSQSVLAVCWSQEKLQRKDLTRMWKSKVQLKLILTAMSNCFTILQLFYMVSKSMIV